MRNVLTFFPFPPAIARLPWFARIHKIPVLPAIVNHCKSLHIRCGINLVPIHFEIFVCFERKKNLKRNEKQNVVFVYSQKPCRNEYGIGDQCRIYWLLLSARSDCANHRVANNSIMPRKRATVWSDCCRWAVCMLFRTDYWWVRPTTQTQTTAYQSHINFLVFLFYLLGAWLSYALHRIKCTVHIIPSHWHSCRQFWCGGLCDISLLFNDFVVNGLGRCNCLSIHTLGGYART